MNQTFKLLLAKYRTISFFVFIASFAFFYLGIIFIDNRWWWSLMFILPLGILTFTAFKNEIYAETSLKYYMYSIFKWITLYFFFFVFISAIFISPFWWFALILVFFLLGILSSFGIGINLDNLSYKENKKTLIVITFIFLITFCLFCIPSFVANSNKNPKEFFSSTWTPVESYSLYGTSPTNTEHIIALSWYPTNNNYANDYINIIISNQTANSARGNLPFGNMRKISINIVYQSGVIIGYKDDKHFMPTDEFKGDVARILLYMYVTYQDDGLDREYINIGLMKTWSRADHVDSREKERNDTIKSLYDYSNKFVNTPWLVGFIV